MAAPKPLPAAPGPGRPATRPRAPATPAPRPVPQRPDFNRDPHPTVPRPTR